MPRIDVFLRTLAKIGASGMTLRSGENLLLHFPSGDRSAVQKIGHADLTAMLDEVAPPEAQAALYMERPTTFDVLFGGRRWSLAATPTGGALTVRLQEGDAEPPVPRQPAPGAGAVDPAMIAPFPTTRAQIAPAVAALPQAAPAPATRAQARTQGAPVPAAVSAPALAQDATDFGSLVQGNAFDAVPAALAEGGIPLGDTPDLEAEAPPALVPTALAPPGAETPAPAATSERLPAASAQTPAPPLVSGGGVAAVPPPRLPARGLVDRLLAAMAKLGASDLHLSTGSKPFLRLHGEMRVLADQEALSADALYAEIFAIMPPRNREEYARRNDTDFAHEIPGLSRYRVNVFRDRFGPGTVLRAIPFEILPPEKLGLPKEVLGLCYLTKGLVLVTGPTGSGKSTTLATLVDYINRQRADHIITIEDPIEFVHDNKRCLVNQREVHLHTDSFKDALRAALREDPDIVLVGEMRDLETIAIAVETAETGHLVFGTLHTTTAMSTVDRVIDQFPADRQDQIRQMLAESLKGVIAQVLCRKVGGGRVAAYEILIGSKAVSNLIRERKTFQLMSLMQTGRNQGMRTLNDSLMELVRKKLVEPKEAYLKAADKTELLGLFKREGLEVEVMAED